MSRLRLQQVKGSTSGSVLFLDNTHGILEDNANFYWNNSTKKLGINTDLPSESLEVVGNQALKGQLKLDSAVSNVTSNDNIVLADSNSSAAIHFNWDGINDIYISPDLGTNHFYVSKLETTMETYGTSGNGLTMTLYNEDNVDGVSRYWLYSHDNITTNRPQIEFRDNRSIQWSTPGNNAYPVVIASRGTIVNSGIVNSLYLGGTNGTIDKNNYLFVNNFEIQSGIGQYTVDPTTNGAWGDLSIPTKKYVDTQIEANNGLAEILGNNNTSGANDIIIQIGQKLETPEILFQNTTNNLVNKKISRNVTTDDTITELFLDGASTTIDITSDSLVSFKIIITGVQTGGSNGAVGDSMIKQIEGGVKNIAGTTSIIGTPTEKDIAIDSGATPWKIYATADDSSDYLKLKVKGGNGESISWSANIELTEINY